MKPWMMWENVYQSVTCCEFSELCTTPCQNLTYPQVQIGCRPIANRIVACSASRPAPITSHCGAESDLPSVAVMRRTPSEAMVRPGCRPCRRAQIPRSHRRGAHGDYSDRDR